MNKILKSVTPAIAMLLLGTVSRAADILNDAMFLDADHPNFDPQTLAIGK